MDDDPLLDMGLPDANETVEMLGLVPQIYIYGTSPSCYSGDGVFSSPPCNVGLCRVINLTMAWDKDVSVLWPPFISQPSRSLPLSITSLAHLLRGMHRISSLSACTNLGCMRDFWALYHAGPQLTDGLTI